jgi:hypothetical protein
MTEQIGKFLIILGSVLVISGLLFLLINRLNGPGEFPGTIKIETGSFSLTIPVLASLLLSIVLTVILNLVVRLIDK